MKTKIISILTIAALMGASGCIKDADFLDQKPPSIITPEEAFRTSADALSVLANLYTRQLDFSPLDETWENFAGFGEAYPSNNGTDWMVRDSDWGYGTWGNWDYGYIREMNLFLERCEASKTLLAGDKARLLAEGRFLRANFYFELTKRMGGVPLILESMRYDFSGDPTYLQHPRAKESEMYDFVISEMEAIREDLPVRPASGTAIVGRVTKGAATAVVARAALYAGSIAKYGVNTPQVSLPGGEVGIPANLANGYYTKALAAAEMIINGEVGPYSLYKKNANLAENFAALFLDKNNNPEAIWVEDYKLRSGRVHGFTIANQPRFGSEEEEGGRINPSINFVEAFERLDNSFAPLPVNAADGTPILYTNPQQLFEGRDARLHGTVITPGSAFKGRPVDIWAGYRLADGTIISSDARGGIKDLPGKPGVQVVGQDGPIDRLEHVAQSGFYIRKYLDPTAGAGSRGTQSEVAYMRYRYAEVLLNAAEAAFELSQPDVAAGYLNQVRVRAGLVTPLTGGDVTFDRIVHERRVELAFEGHLLFDMKRWRIAHIKWDGNPLSQAELTTNLGSATRRNTQPWALWPYKIYEPGSPNDGKWYFQRKLLSSVTGARRFRLGNYYSFIGDDIRANNPKIVRQPNQ
ncbi:RagB/SusD family nutrient uptake outer membrane protein [Chitinophaga horti]|uniref:RagB/SusD family nutrient uptake outer membrane protein n=1 Tax=Chitinophaga horti TaxID=2920382 RepID=A0ABY6IZB9_9BACT|nr:RagB/SusD family nutrient uptake outer membrane protein [Chitinophaga horti]UYQ91747.1 RagB/SusD family nutrient uptake outer membrane protein [Chitinophaga horti]